MTPAWAAVGVAGVAALGDLLAPVPASPSGLRRLLRAVAAGALAVALRLAGAPPLPAAALLAFGVADALALDGAEPGVGGWTLTLLAQLLLAAAVWELGSPGALLREPWRGIGAAAVLAGAVALALSGRRPRGEMAALAPAPVLLLAVAAAGVGAQTIGALALPFAAAVALWTASLALAWTRGPAAGLPRLERALRSTAPLAFALPLLPAVTGL